TGAGRVDNRDGKGRTAENVTAGQSQRALPPAHDDGETSAAFASLLRQPAGLRFLAIARDESDGEPGWRYVLPVGIDGELLRNTDARLRQRTLGRALIIEPANMDMTHGLEPNHIAIIGAIAAADAEILRHEKPVAIGTRGDNGERCAARRDHFERCHIDIKLGEDGPGSQPFRIITDSAEIGDVM